MLIHGGYWQTRYGKFVMRPVAGDLVRRGWAAWNLEYRRLGSGRGGGGGWPQTFDDVAAGIDLLERVAGDRLDLDRVVAVGHSAGGQLALWAGARTDGARVRIGAVAALAAVSNVAATGEVGRRLLGGGPDEVPERYDAADPIRAVPLPVPVLLVHPTADATVPVRRSREYAAAAAAAGGDVELIETLGGHRAPIDPSTPAWRTAAAWVERRGSRGTRL